MFCESSYAIMDEVLLLSLVCCAKMTGEHRVPLSSPLYNFEIVIPSKDGKADIGCYGILCIPIHSGFLCR